MTGDLLSSDREKNESHPSQPDRTVATRKVGFDRVYFFSASAIMTHLAMVFIKETSQKGVMGMGGGTI